MKTLTLDDKLYSALRGVLRRDRDAPSENWSTEAIESWLFDDELDEAELAEIEAVQRD